ncbi:hypothetical protein HPB51_014129 [Rhipicephalus microplus]|uniref:Uncharacterized protein n=1 Tax=Rhipicephalus microplus TaxID=6941 RepID=A0A9J6E1P8_RHIMP|nr:hypothetical protein HPB51_014129 [Rhipicephalus microplus]
MLFARLPAQLSGGGPTPQLPSTRVVFALLIASSVFITTVADGDSASSSLHSEQHRDDPSLSCPPDDQCDTKKWCSAIAAVIADDKKGGAADDEYDHGVKCLDEQVVDRCGCCRECVRGSPGLPCGGIRRLGVCAAPLECLADVAVGRIAEPHEEGTCHASSYPAVVERYVINRADEEKKNVAPLFRTPGATTFRCGVLMIRPPSRDVTKSGCRVPECAERRSLGWAPLTQLSAVPNDSFARLCELI